MENVTIQILGVKVESANWMGWMSHQDKRRYIFKRNNTRYEINRIFNGVEAVEAWNLEKGSYCLISISEISEITIERGE